MAAAPVSAPRHDPTRAAEAAPEVPTPEVPAVLPAAGRWRDRC